VVRVGRGHAEDVVVQELSAERCHRNCNSRFERSSVTHAIETTKQA
jgi:hypothetical protein